MKHTKGPWKVVKRPSAGLSVEWGYDDNEIRPICHMRWSDGLNPVTEKQIWTDANLIAAAPQLLEALEEIIAELDNRPLKQGEYGYSDTGGMVLARLAIKKATDSESDGR